MSLNPDDGVELPDETTVAGYLASLYRLRGTPGIRTVAAATGVSRTSVETILKGRYRRRPRWSTIEPLALYLRADMDRVTALWSTGEAELDDRKATMVALLTEIRDLLRELVNR